MSESEVAPAECPLCAGHGTVHPGLRQLVFDQRDRYQAEVGRLKALLAACLPAVKDAALWYAETGRRGPESPGPGEADRWAALVRSVAEAAGPGGGSGG